MEIVNERLGICVDDLVVVSKEDIDGLKLFVTEGDAIKVGETVEVIDETTSRTREVVNDTDGVGVELDVPLAVEVAVAEAVAEAVAVAVALAVAVAVAVAEAVAVAVAEAVAVAVAVAEAVAVEVAVALEVAEAVGVRDNCGGLLRDIIDVGVYIWLPDITVETVGLWVTEDVEDTLLLCELDVTGLGEYDTRGVEESETILPEAVGVFNGLVDCKIVGDK